MKIKQLLFILLLLGIIILCTIRWNAWFSNPPEASYSTPAYPDRIILSMGENTADTRVVSWRCDSVSHSGYVELWQTEAGDTLRVEATDSLIKSRSGSSCFYQATLRELKPNTNYHYRVVTNSVYSAVYRFIIPNEQDSLSFIMLGDIQDSINGNTGAIFNDIYQHFPDISFWAVNGDVIERPTDTYWNYWFTSMEGITQTVPIVAATGNHEYLKSMIKKLDSRWTSTFRNPTNGPKGFIGRTYQLDFNNLSLFVLDTDGLQTPTDYLRVRNWLSEALTQTDSHWKIVMMHHPIYSVRSGRDNALIRWIFKPLLEQHKVDLVLEGHDHGYSRMTTKNDTLHPTTPVYITTNCSPKQYPIGFDLRHDRLGSDLNFYQYITVKENTLSTAVYTTKHALYDELLFTKNAAGMVSITDHAINLPEVLELPESYKGWRKEKREKYEQEKEERVKQRNITLQ